MPRDNLYLAEIVEAIDRITRWLEGIDEHGWDGDEMRRAAVVVVGLAFGAGSVADSATPDNEGDRGRVSRHRFAVRRTSTIDFES
jgi:hypothetical protein